MEVLLPSHQEKHCLGDIQPPSAHYKLFQLHWSTQCTRCQVQATNAIIKGDHTSLWCPGISFGMGDHMLDAFAHCRFQCWATWWGHGHCPLCSSIDDISCSQVTAQAIQRSLGAINDAFDFQCTVPTNQSSVQGNRDEPSSGGPGKSYLHVL